ncbi:MAG: hypothetical protein MI784_07240, partial [Cytophagales bacterium]|nr:hypothetical protein [Cytophagales bacterium]
MNLILLYKSGSESEYNVNMQEIYCEEVNSYSFGPKSAITFKDSGKPFEALTCPKTALFHNNLFGVYNDLDFNISMCAYDGADWFGGAKVEIDNE